MKITVYSLVTDDRNGTEVDVFKTNAEAEAAAIAYLMNEWQLMKGNEPVPDIFDIMLDRLMDMGFNDLVRVERHDLDLGERYYVTMTWDDFPEGGSYGTIVRATSHAEAEELCRQEMAQTREDSGVTAAQVREMHEHEWHTIDCIPFEEFVAHNLKVTNR